MTDSSTRIPASELANLVGSRLCHDLVSPLGAISNGVELLQMSGPGADLGAGPEMQLISEAVEAARGRIQVFRVAFGQASPDQRVSQPDLKKLLQAMAAQGKLYIELEAEGDQPRRQVQLVLLAIMCLESAMPWGGHVTVLRNGAGWRLVGDSDRTKPDPALWSWLDDPAQTPNPPAPQPAKVQFALLSQTAQQMGLRLGWNLDEKGAEITF